MEEYNCKIVLVGDNKCGKTSLVHRFIHDKFLEVYTPTDFRVYTTTYEVNDYRINFTIWDTSGAAAYDKVRPLTYQDARVLLLCFQIPCPNSLDNIVNKWYPEIRQHCPNIPVILCGCQSDLRNDTDVLRNLSKLKKTPVTSEQALAASRQISATTYVETTTKHCGKTVKDAFEVIALASLGKLNKNHVTIQRHRSLMKRKYKSKIDLKEELRDKARNCTLM